MIILLSYNFVLTTYLHNGLLLFFPFSSPVPAKIIEHLSTKDVIVRENEQVTLVCNVTGVPAPEVTWYRNVDEGGHGKERQSEFCPTTEVDNRKNLDTFIRAAHIPLFAAWISLGPAFQFQLSMPCSV
jgi:hypothetical protein